MAKYERGYGCKKDLGQGILRGRKELQETGTKEKDRQRSWSGSTKRNG